MSDSTSDCSIAESTLPDRNDDSYHPPPNYVLSTPSISDISNTPSLSHSLDSGDDLHHPPPSGNEPVHTSSQDTGEMNPNQTEDSAPAEKPKAKPTQDPAPQPLLKSNRLPQKTMQKLLLEVSGLPIVAWHEQKRQWIEPGLLPRLSMQDEVRIMIKTDLNEKLIRELLTATVHRQKEEPEYSKHVCFGCAVSLGDRELCSNDELSTTVCGQLCQLPGNALDKAFAFGFLPLPEEWRQSCEYRTVAYYVRAETKVKPAVPKCKERDWFVRG